MTQIENYKQLKIKYVASEILLFLTAFETDDYEKAIMGCTTQCREQLMEELSDALAEKSGRYFEVIEYLKKRAHGETRYLGMKKFKRLDAELLASNILYEIESLDRPIHINKPSTLPEDF